MRKSFILPAIFLFLLISSKPTLAHHQAVLGVATESALPQLQPTAEGPGFLLPDSPFFFLDRFKQTIRTTFAFRPEEKAKIRSQIAGERLAELRFMLAKNNQAAARIALDGVSENLKEAASQVSKAQFSGKDVKKLAKEVNDGIKAKQKILDDLEAQSTGSLRLQVAQAQEDIFKSKVEVEDSLSEDELENEIKDDLARRIERRVENASQSAKLLGHDLDEFNKEASESASKSLKRREEAIKKAIEKRDEVLIKAEEKLLEAEKKKQEGILKAQKKASEQAQEALKKAQEAASKFKEARQKVTEIKSQSAGETNQTSEPEEDSDGDTRGRKL